MRLSTCAKGPKAEETVWDQLQEAREVVVRKHRDANAYHARRDRGAQDGDARGRWGQAGGSSMSICDRRAATYSRGSTSARAVRHTLVPVRS
jgi:hypothetical protein